MAGAQLATVWDYVVFAVILALSSIIGIYYGCKMKNKSAKDYLIAGGDMHWFPISLSLCATFFSAVGMLGVPSEVYTFGFSFIFHLIGFWLICIIAATVYAPIFYRSKITSANEVCFLLSQQISCGHKQTNLTSNVIKRRYLLISRQIETILYIKDLIG